MCVNGFVTICLVDSIGYELLDESLQPLIGLLLIWIVTLLARDLLCSKFMSL